jgi:hypothetical protein
MFAASAVISILMAGLLRVVQGTILRYQRNPVLIGISNRALGCSTVRLKLSLVAPTFSRSIGG